MNDSVRIQLRETIIGNCPRAEHAQWLRRRIENLGCALPPTLAEVRDGAWLAIKFRNGERRRGSTIIRVGHEASSAAFERHLTQRFDAGLLVRRVQVDVSTSRANRHCIINSIRRASTRKIQNTSVLQQDLIDSADLAA